MVIDTSALVAMLRNEPEREAFSRAVYRDPTRLISSVTKFEASVVALVRFGPAALTRLDRLLSDLAATIVPFDEDQADIARDAYARYGKGRHPARLNLGDCAAYALAIAENQPLLFKGTDFAATDVAVVPV